MLKMAPSLPPGPTPLHHYRLKIVYRGRIVSNLLRREIKSTIQFLIQPNRHHNFYTKLEPWVNFSKTENSASINPLDCCVQDAAVESLVVTHIIYDFSFASSDTFFLSDIKPLQYQRKSRSRRGKDDKSAKRGAPDAA